MRRFPKRGKASDKRSVRKPIEAVAASPAARRDDGIGIDAPNRPPDPQWRRELASGPEDP